MKITILVDNDSWILPYADKLSNQFSEDGIDVKLVRDASEIREGWCCFLLGCVRLVNEECLKRNRHNLVVHESNLPKGRGFAPMTWQILEGKSVIPVCLLEASIGEPDTGRIWIRDIISLDGSELAPEWRKKQGLKTVELCRRFVENYERLIPEDQVGNSSSYSRRRPEHSELDINKTIAEQKDLLRVVDNENYPAFIYIDGSKYFIRIEKA